MWNGVNLSLGLEKDGLGSVEYRKHSECKCRERAGMEECEK